MAEAVTQTYDEMILEVEFVASSGTYTPVCGLTGVTVNRGKTLTTTEVPDCADATKPHQVRKDERSIDVSVTATGVWARSSQSDLKDWFYGNIGPKLNARLRDLDAENNGASGDVYAETGPALLTALNNERPADKGRVTAGVEIQFDGTPTLSTVV